MQGDPGVRKEATLLYCMFRPPAVVVLLQLPCLISGTSYFEGNETFFATTSAPVSHPVPCDILIGQLSSQPLCTDLLKRESQRKLGRQIIRTPNLGIA